MTGNRTPEGGGADTASGGATTATTAPVSLSTRTTASSGHHREADSHRRNRSASRAGALNCHAIVLVAYHLLIDDGDMKETEATLSEPRLLTISEAQAVLRLGRTFIWREVATGRLATVRLGRRRLVRPVDLGHYIAERVEGGPTLAPDLAPPRRGRRRRARQ